MTGQKGERVRVAIICPVVVRHDAISAAVYDTWRILARDGRFSVSVLTSRCDFPELAPRLVRRGVSDLLIAPEFLAADILIYHFGIYGQVFDALLIGNGHGRQVVFFHNVTPLEFASPANRDVIARSFRQLSNLRHADQIWPVSPVNADLLADRGFGRERVHQIPLVVETPSLMPLEGKAPRPIDILFVGRFVPSKGVLDLIRALALMHRGCKVPMRLRLVGNESFSERDYLAAVRSEIAAAGFGFPVEMLGTIDDDRLFDLYRSSHVFAIPSYHEGFCKTAVEALRAGAVPVGYAAHNLPNVVGGLGRLAPTGDVPALAAALQAMVESIAAGLAKPDRAHLPLDRGAMSVRSFDQAAKRYVESFSFEHISKLMLDRLSTVSVTAAPKA